MTENKTKLKSETILDNTIHKDTLFVELFKFYTQVIVEDIKREYETYAEDDFENGKPSLEKFMEDFYKENSYYMIETFSIGVDEQFKKYLKVLKEERITND